MAKLVAPLSSELVQIYTRSNDTRLNADVLYVPNVVGASLSDFGPMDARRMLELLSRRVFIDTVIGMNVVAARDVWLIRHGETEWTESRRHTGFTDLRLTRTGEDQARSLRNCLQRARFERVFCSPLRRAARTCELSGYGSIAEVDRDLVEWKYGD